MTSKRDEDEDIKRCSSIKKQKHQTQFQNTVKSKRLHINVRTNLMFASDSGQFALHIHTTLNVISFALQF